MNTANNSRRRETIDKIEKAFIEMLQTKELNDISISELCKNASVNRTTFYSCCDGLYDIADSLREKLENSLFEIYKDEIVRKFNSNDYLKLFKHIEENQIFYRTYFKLGYDNQYKIVQYDREAAEKYFGNKFINYHMEFFKAGITKIIKMWLDGGCKESAEDMAEIIRSEYSRRV